MEAPLFTSSSFKVQPIGDDDLPLVLQIYQQSEDFLSLGPVSTASMAMVLDDIQHSKRGRGVYCGIWDCGNVLLGIVDFVPRCLDEETSFLSLLMIAAPHRSKGIGHTVVDSLENYLQQKYSIKRMLSAVQVSNEQGIRFWQKCGYQVDPTPTRQEDTTVTFRLSKDLSA
jgi:ribosomal protein S18 acetylase RimI-like enzyme